MPKRSDKRPRPMVRAPRSPRPHLALAGLLLTTAFAWLCLSAWQSRPPSPPPPLQPAQPAQPLSAAPPPVALADSLYAGADAALEAIGLWPALIAKRRGQRDTLDVRVPGDVPLASANWTLTALVRRHGGRVLHATETARGDRVHLLVGRDSVGTSLFRLRQVPDLRRRTGDIALVIDDFGGYSRLASRFCALHQSLTLAVLPNEGPVDSLVALARRHGHQIMLHLPMEPEDYPRNDPGQGAVLVEDDDETIRQRVRDALRQVPEAVGLNNHMGSRATADPRVMAAVLDEVAARGLFFLDSGTSAASVAYDTARRLEVKTARRDLFLDEDDDPEAIRARLWELAELAASNGRAIGIGHDREATLLALETVLPQLEERGFRFVPVAQLTR